MRGSRLWIAILGVLVLACALRIVAAAQWHNAAASEGRLFRLGDSHSYWTLATELAHGRPYQYGSEHAKIFRAPVYPIVLAPWTWINDPHFAVWCARLMGCLLGTLSVGLVMILAHRLGGPAAALSSGVLAAIYPGAIGMSIVIWSEAVFCPLMLSHLLLWQVAWSKPHWRQGFTWSLLAGLFAGLGVLARPSWLLFSPMVFFVGVLCGPRRGQHVAIFVGTLLGCSLAMSPWWVRNASITGKFVLTTLQVGPSLYDGLHAGASGASDEGMNFMQEFLQQQLQADATTDSLESTLEYRLNRRAQQAAVHWVLEHPGETAMLAIRKFLRTWTLWPNGGEVGSVTLRLALTVGCFGILALAMMGSWPKLQALTNIAAGATDWRWQLGLYWLPCLYFTLLHMIFVASIRYREPAILVLTVIAGWTIAERAQGSASTERKQTG